MPSERIIEEICTNPENLVKQYTIFEFPKENSSTLETHLRSIFSGVSHQIAEFYHWGLDIKKNMITQKLQLVLEALTNSVAHSLEKSIHYGLFLGDKGVCHGFRDFGDYFKSSIIKQKFENKEEVAKKDGITKGFSGCHAGVEHYLYPYSDTIEVDTNKGILYCVQLKKSLDKNVSRE